MTKKLVLSQPISLVGQIREDIQLFMHNTNAGYGAVRIDAVHAKLLEMTYSEPLEGRERPGRKLFFIVTTMRVPRGNIWHMAYEKKDFMKALLPDTRSYLR